MRSSQFLYPFIFVFFAGCASSPKPVFNAAMTADELHDRFVRMTSSVTDFSAEGSITVNSTSMNQSAGFELSARGADSVKMSLFGPFGITVGSALFTRNEFTAYNALTNTVYRGSPEKQMRMLPFVKDIPFELLIGSLQGIHPFRIAARIDSVTVNAEHTYSFTVMNDDRTYDKFTYDSYVNRVTRCVRKNSGGATVWSVKYWYTNSDDSTIVPEQVEVRVPSKELTLLLEYSGVKYDSLTTALTISYPKDAEIITIE